MNKISKTDENRMLDTINRVMGRCAKGDDPSAAVASSALESNLSTEQAARVCEAVNKIASISYLSTHQADRDATFPLADSEEVKQLMRDSRKVASEPMRFRKTANEGLHVMTVEEMHAKIACSPDIGEVPGVDPKWAYSATWQKVQENTQALKLASDEARLGKMKLEMEFTDLAKRFDGLSKEASEDAARYAINYYGENGEKFLNALENVGVEPMERVYRPYVKTGSDIERRIDSFMTHTDQYLALKYAADFFGMAVKEAKKKGGPDGYDPKTYDLPDMSENAMFKHVDEIIRKKDYGGAPNVHIDRGSKNWKATYHRLIAELGDREKGQQALAEARYNAGKDQNLGGDWRMKEFQRKEKEALADRKWLEDQRALEGAKTVYSGASSGFNAGSGFVGDIISNAISNTKSAWQMALEGMQQANELRKALQPPRLSGNEYSEPLSLKGKKYLDSLDLHDSFAKAYLSDPYLRQYSPEEVAEAFNIVHEVAPDLITNKTSPHVVSAMLRKYLANNNQIDPLEIKDLATTELTRKNINKAEVELQNMKRNKPVKTDK